MLRTELYADPRGIFVHDLVACAAERFGELTAIVDTSCQPERRISFAEYADVVTRVARGVTSANVKPGDVIAIFLLNSWEFCAAYHAATRAGAIPTLINPSYRERELRYQLEASGASLLITDGPLLSGVDLSGLPKLRSVYVTRSPASGAQAFGSLLSSSSQPLPALDADTRLTLAALPFSSGTTGLPKGVMLTHSNLVSNVYQLLGPNAGPQALYERVLCFLPLYHIYGLNVALNPAFVLGMTLVLMPRFDLVRALHWIRTEEITFLPCVPPILNAFVQAAEKGEFPRDHKVRFVKSGAAPLAAELARERARHRAAQRTLVGPHRDELVVAMAGNGMAAANCSTGEQKAMLIAITLAHAALAAAGRPGVLLLDEVAAHLDPVRRAALFERLREGRAQAWLTGTELAPFAEIEGEAAVWRVANGTVERLS